MQMYSSVYQVDKSLTIIAEYLKGDSIPMRLLVAIIRFHSVVPSTPRPGRKEFV
jgi:hypothetical protein